MTGKMPFALLLCAVPLCAAIPAVGERSDPVQTARRGRGSDDYLEKAPATASPAQAQPAAADPKAMALFEAKCSICHELSRPLGRNKDRNGWTATVTRMQQVNGCPVTDEEAKAIIDYLVAVRGPAGNR
jgi:cytochrome c5